MPLKGGIEKAETLPSTSAGQVTPGTKSNNSLCFESFYDLLFESYNDLWSNDDIRSESNNAAFVLKGMMAFCSNNDFQSHDNIYFKPQ
jgi:hypothetical protein